MSNSPEVIEQNKVNEKKSAKVDARTVLVKILGALDENPHSLAKRIGVSYNKMYEIYCGRTKTISPVIEDLLVTKCGVSRVFFRTCSGNILEGDDSTCVSSDDMVNSFVTVVQQLNAKIKQLQDRVDFLSKYIKEKGLEVPK